ncbi:MAG: 23S rRNA (adenine(2503)-C(2))-methyltransferase RlmN, partial [Anaerolineae bacterium]|nr:23S rRNA (adenine(2503)-C(2))-methyltransferase RlmN [Anaerolineae bacterium]
MSDSEKTPRLLDLSRAELVDYMRALGQPSYRADQVRQWLYKQLVTDPAEMTSLPLALREQLADEASGAVLTPVVETHSSDGQTTKTLFRLHDGQLIETVLMRYHRR